MANQPVILLIDDECDLVEVLREALTLKKPDYEVRVATSVDDAESLVQQLRTQGADLALVVVDQVLDGQSGLELLARLRGDDPSLRSLLYTGQATPEMAERAMQLGARVLWKPMPLRTWLGEVEAALAS